MQNCFRATRNFKRLGSLCLGLIIISSGRSFAIETPAAPIPLFFPADRNKVKILPPLFEYTALGDEKIKIGDVLIDASQIKFEIIKSKLTNRFRIRVSWPSALSEEGVLLLQNNNGVAIWEQSFQKNKISIQPMRDAENFELRSEIATYTSGELDNDLFERMKDFPFMKFCVNRARGDTRIQVCSKEIYLAANNGKMSIKSRTTNLKEPKVSINNESVESQGVIYLNDVTQLVSLRAETVSGALIEIDTRLKAVDFRDLTLSADQKNLVLEAHGAEPVVASKVERLPNGNWRSLLPLDRPLVYIEGEGGIPLRQEFLLSGPAPHSDQRVYLKPQSVTQTYSSRVEVVGTLARGTKIKPVEEEDEIIMSSPQEFRWKLSDLQAGTTNRYYATVMSDKGQWVVAHDVYRGYPQSISGHLQALFPWNQVAGQVRFERWTEHFLGLNSETFKDRWGFGAELTQSLAQNSGTSKLTEFDFDIGYRTKAGLVPRDASPEIRFYYSQFKFDPISVWSPGLGIKNSSAEPFAIIATWFPTLTYGLDYFFSANSSGFSFGGLGRAHLSLVHENSVQSSYEVGVIFQSWSLPSSTSVDTTQFGLRAGTTYLF